jgi:hypothetical protein
LLDACAEYKKLDSPNIMAFQVTECTEDQVWDEFVSSSSQGSIFCKTDFLRTLGESFRRYLVIDGGQPIAGTVLMLRDGLPLPAPYACAEYQGVMFGKNIAALPTHRRTLIKLNIVDCLLAELSGCYPFLSFSLHYDFDDLRSFLWFNFHEPDKGKFTVDLRYTGLINLREIGTQEEFLYQVRELRRREFNRAIKSGVRVEHSKDIQLLHQLYELTFERQAAERPLDEARVLESVAQGALDHQFGEFLIARCSTGEVASAYLFLYDEKSAYYLYGGNHPEFRNTGASTYLMFYALDFFKRRGASHFDFVGINSPNRGDYKTSFSAIPKPYYVVNWARPK